MASVLLNGSTDYLSIANATQIVPGTGDFTIEAWVYLNDYNLINPVASMGDTATDNNGTGSWFFGPDATTGRLTFATGGTQYLTSAGPVVPLNTWCHVALTRSGTSFRVWLNGVVGATQTLSYNMNGSATFKVGRGRGASTNFFSGFITDVRVVIGTAVYTTNFSVPTTRLTAVSGTKFLFAPDSITSQITDSSSNNYTIVKNGLISKLGNFDPLPIPITVDSASSSQVSGTNFQDFAGVNASKTLLVSNLDALIDKNVTNPEEAYTFS